MSAANKTTLRRANEAVSRGDFEGFLAYCTEDTEWNFVGEQVLKGRTAVLQWMRKSYLEPPRLKVDHMIADENFLTAVGTVSMKNEKGSWDDFDYADVWEFRDGLMAGLRAFVVKRN